MTVVYNEPNPQQVWKAVLGDLQVQMPRATFDTWVKNTTVVSYEDGMFVIGAPNTYAVEWLENRLHGALLRSAAQVMRRSVDLRFIVRPTMMVHTEPPMPLSYPAKSLSAGEEDEQRPAPPPPALNPKHIFNTFIVGNSNRLAHAA